MNRDKHLDSTSKGISTNTSIAPRKESRQTPRLHLERNVDKHLDCVSKEISTNTSIASQKESRRQIENIPTTCRKYLDNMSQKSSRACREDLDNVSQKISRTCRQELDNTSTRSRQHVDKISRTRRQDLDNMSNRNSKFLRITLSRMNEKVLHRSLEGVIKYGLESDWSK